MSLSLSSSVFISMHVVRTHNEYILSILVQWLCVTQKGVNFPPSLSLPFPVENWNFDLLNILYVEMEGNEVAMRDEEGVLRTHKQHFFLSCFCVLNAQLVSLLLSKIDS